MVEIYNRNTLFVNLKDRCIFSKEHDFIEVTEWYNMEGFDVTISDKPVMSFTNGQFDVLVEIIEVMRKQ